MEDSDFEEQAHDANEGVKSVIWGVACRPPILKEELGRLELRVIERGEPKTRWNVDNKKGGIMADPVCPLGQSIQNVFLKSR